MKEFLRKYTQCKFIKHEESENEVESEWEYGPAGPIDNPNPDYVMAEEVLEELHKAPVRRPLNV